MRQQARLLYELSLREEDIDPSSDVYKVRTSGGVSLSACLIVSAPLSLCVRACVSVCLYVVYVRVCDSDNSTTTTTTTHIRSSPPQDTHPLSPTHTPKQQTVPVEEFGAALLRGMGWKGPSEEDVTVFQAQPRPQGSVLIWIMQCVCMYTFIYVCVCACYLSFECLSLCQRCERQTTTTAIATTTHCCPLPQTNFTTPISTPLSYND